MQGVEQNRLIETYNNAFKSPDRKYDFQVGIKDLDFDVNYLLVKAIGLTIPFMGIAQAEFALTNRALCINAFKELDDTNHSVILFDPRPIGYSGFMNCVRHSLAMTNHGVFEIGRYKGASLSPESSYWQWFIHRRLVSIEEAHSWMGEQAITSNQFMEQIYQALVEQ